MPKIVDDEYLDLSDCNLSLGKIYTTKFGGLLGVDNFNPKGDTFLLMQKVIPSDPFKKLYGLRGDIAEKLVKRYFDLHGIKYKWYGADTDTYDMFDNPVFGGNLDFAIESNNIISSVEVKSKNIKDYDFIKRNGIQPTHLSQSQLGIYLSGYNSGYVFYVFFTNEQEQKIESGIFDINLDWNLDMYKTQMLPLKVNFDEVKVEEQMQEAYDYCLDCFMEKRIPLKDVSDKALNKLGLKRNINIFKRGINNSTFKL
jgi:hypothetical protein